MRVKPDRRKNWLAKTLAIAVSNYGAKVKPKLANIAIDGAPEDQLRGPLDLLIQDLAELGDLSSGSVHLVGETTLSDLKTRPDFAATVNKALVGFIEVKAPSVPSGWPDTYWDTDSRPRLANAYSPSVRRPDTLSCSHTLRFAAVRCLVDFPTT
jgi:hypothetical protein